MSTTTILLFVGGLLLAGGYKNRGDLLKAALKAAMPLLPKLIDSARVHIPDAIEPLIDRLVDQWVAAQAAPAEETAAIEPPVVAEVSVPAKPKTKAKK